MTILGDDSGQATTTDPKHDCGLARSGEHVQMRKRLDEMPGQGATKGTRVSHAVCSEAGGLSQGSRSSKSDSLGSMRLLTSDRRLGRDGTMTSGV